MPQQRKRLTGAPVSRRKKPAHRTIHRHRSVLRMGDDLIRFKDFINESTPRSAPPGAYANDANIEEDTDEHPWHCHKHDHDDGYRAGWEFHMGNGKRERNPHNEDTHPHCYNSWQQGFEQAGEDS